jgi:carboxyl-terminal processing protease
MMLSTISRMSVATLVLTAFVVVPYATPQETKLDTILQTQTLDILRSARDEVRRHYYDPKLAGLDWDARYKEYSTRIAKVRNLGDGFRGVAAFLSGLKDSHTYFVPPSRPEVMETGYKLALIGDACFIKDIRPKSDAESKLHLGDRVETINNYNVNRQDFHDLQYYFSALAPQDVFQLKLQSPAGDSRTVMVRTSSRQLKRTIDLTDGDDVFETIRREEQEGDESRSQVVELGDSTIWKLRHFDIDASEVEKVINKARKHQTLIIDLRGNSGGSVDTLQWIVGSLFDQELRIADRIGRTSRKPMIAKPLGTPFDGKLIVLIDAGSASASEVLARVVQLQHRGKILGDRSAGAVMEAIYYPESIGADTKIFFGFSVTDANLIMQDGHSLEGVGVSPDETILPTGSDLAGGLDPVLARAAELAGIKLSAADAGKMFPTKWAPL